MKQRRDYKSKRVHKKNHKELIGYFQKPKGSHTHCVVDRASEEKFKIGKSELRKAFPGDLVRYHLTPKGWASIDSVLKSNTKNFIGKITRNGKVTFSSPVGLEDIVRIKIKGDIPKKISTETLVEIILTKQPAVRQIGEGFIKRTISEDNILEIAKTGVNLISSGWLTHSSPALDIGLDFS